jgi:hypothetical protein
MEAPMVNPQNPLSYTHPFEGPTQELACLLRADLEAKARTLELRRSQKRLRRLARWIGVRYGGLPTAKQARRAEWAMKRAEIFPPTGWEDL